MSIITCHTMTLSVFRICFAILLFHDEALVQAMKPINLSASSIKTRISRQIGSGLIDSGPGLGKCVKC